MACTRCAVVCGVSNRRRPIWSSCSARSATSSWALSSSEAYSVRM
jgi:hypothetical protein